MSDVARLRQILPARSQLPVSWYFDAEHFALEKRLLFDAGANYVGHSLMVPNVGDYYTLAWTNHARMLVHNDAGIDLRPMCAGTARRSCSKAAAMRRTSSAR